MPFEGEPRARATRDPSPRFASSSNDWLLPPIRSIRGCHYRAGLK